MRPLRIAQISSELAPFAKTGGLGDVCGALPRYLAAAGHDIRPFVPLYGNLKEGRDRLVPVDFVQDVPVRLGPHTFTFSLYAAPLPGTQGPSGLSTPVYFVRCAPLFDRVETYSGRGDEHLRFAMLSKAALESCQRMGFSPDVLHCHDWHAALAPLFLVAHYGWDRECFHATKTVLTIHNVGYQGTCGAEAVKDLGLEGVRSMLHQEDLARGRFSFLLHGILYANALTTVSTTHAREMMTPEQGMGLDAYLRARRDAFVGIVNGIDAAIWSPEHDRHLPATYSRADRRGKAECRRHLLQSTGLAPDPKGPVFGIVSRMTMQKGFELCFDVLPQLLAGTDTRLVVLGSGERRYTEYFHDLARRFPRKASYREGYDEPFAHRIEAGADVFLMPSRFEPCGLNQMYSMRFGTAPIVHRTGGLADTVTPFDRETERGTGFSFEHFTTTGLRWAIGEALKTWRDPAAWSRLVGNAMAEDWSWERQIRHYEALYRRVCVP